MALPMRLYKVDVEGEILVATGKREDLEKVASNNFPHSIPLLITETQMKEAYVKDIEYLYIKETK